jgi:hypothetical protein
MRDEDGLDTLTAELYALEDAGDSIWVHMLRYVESHRDEFFLDAPSPRAP